MTTPRHSRATGSPRGPADVEEDDTASVSSYSSFPLPYLKRRYYGSQNATTNHHLVELTEKLQKVQFQETAHVRPPQYEVPLLPRQSIDYKPMGKHTAVTIDHNSTSRPTQVRKTLEASPTQCPRCQGIQGYDRMKTTTVGCRKKLTSPSQQAAWKSSSENRAKIFRKEEGKECVRYRRTCDAERYPLKDMLRKLQHYHLDLSNLPFLLTNKSKRSHNISANIQQLIGRLKTHHPDLCQSRESCCCGCSRMWSAEPNSGELERRYAAVYGYYEKVKTDLADFRIERNSNEWWSLRNKKSALRSQLRDILWQLTVVNRHIRRSAAERNLLSCGIKSDNEVHGVTLVDLLRDLRGTQDLYA